MRINAGRYRNHNIEITNLDTTRETSDKVRQAIFNLIGQFFDGETALDLFAGSGAMGLEAISRGCSSCVFNDLNPKALQTVKKNIDKLKVAPQTTLINKDFKDCLNSLNGQKFDLIFLDPPYNMKNVDEILSLIKENDLLDILDTKLKEVVYYRELYPEYSLQELSEIMSAELGYTITKSGLNHRFRKLKEIASNIDKSMNG